MTMMTMMTTMTMMTVIMMTEMMVSIRVSSLEGPVTIHHSKSAGKTRCADQKRRNENQQLSQSIEIQEIFHKCIHV